MYSEDPVGKSDNVLIYQDEKPLSFRYQYSYQALASNVVIQQDTPLPTAKKPHSSFTKRPFSTRNMTKYKLAPVNHKSTSNLLNLTSINNVDVLGVPLSNDPSLAPYSFKSPISRIAVPSTQFKRATVSYRPVNGSGYTCNWDQAGFLFVRPKAELPEPSAENPGASGTAPSFVKIGIELWEKKLCHMICSSHNDMTDWTLHAIPEEYTGEEDITMEISRFGNRLAIQAVYGQAEQKLKRILRIVPWCFVDEVNGQPDVWIAVYVSRPDAERTTREPLVVQFHDFEIEDLSGVNQIDG